MIRVSSSIHLVLALLLISGAACLAAGVAASSLFGFEGTLRLRSGQPSNIAELDEREVVISDGQGPALRVAELSPGARVPGLPGEWRVEGVVSDARRERALLYAPSSAAAHAMHAMHLTGPGGQELWLELGVPARMRLGGREYTLFYAPRETVLPFFVSAGPESDHEGYEVNPVPPGLTLPERHLDRELLMARGSALFRVRHDPGMGLRRAGSTCLVLALALFLSSFPRNARLPERPGKSHARATSVA